MRSSGVLFLNSSRQVVADTITPGTMLIFADETGHEDFRGNPVFGIGGIAVMATRYVEHVRELWFALKERLVESADSLLHAADFPRDGEHEGLICDFFRTGKFFRFAVVTPKPLSLPDGEVFPRGPGKAHAVYEALSLTLRQVLAYGYEGLRCEVSQVVFAQEGSSRIDVLADRYFRQFALAEPYEHIPVRLARTGKGLSEPGCEVADFVVNEAGRQTRSMLRGETGVLRRFDSMFETGVPLHLRAYIPMRGFEATVTVTTGAEGRPNLHAEVRIKYGLYPRAPNGEEK